MTEEEFISLTRLCRIACSPEEKEALCARVSEILSYSELLQEVNTQDIDPCCQVIESLSNIFRSDSEGPVLSREEFLSNTQQIAGMVRVPPVLTQE